MNTKIEKEFELDQPIDLVWKSLSDPTDIVTCVPGASITEKIDDRNYKGEVVTKFGPIKAKYNGDIEIKELDETNHQMVLVGKGLDSKGKGSADMIMHGNLSEENGKTKVKFTMDITIVGMLAQFGSRLINDVSAQLLSQFVTNFKEKLASAAPAVSAEAVNVASPAEPTTTIADVGEVKATTVAAATTKQTEEPDNALNATSLLGTIFKSIFGGIWDSIKSLFGGKKS